MQRSDQWQDHGQAYAQQARNQLAAADAPPLQAMGHAAADTDLFAVWRCGRRHASPGRPPCSGRRSRLATGAQVHRHADMGWRHAFGNAFAFAPMRWRPMPTGRANLQAPCCCWTMTAPWCGWPKVACTARTGGCCRPAGDGGGRFARCGAFPNRQCVCLTVTKSPPTRAGMGR